MRTGLTTLNTRDEEVSAAIGSGLRWSELVELRLGDLDVDSGVLTVARTVVELRPRFHPNSGRFLVKEYPKNREFRPR